jgi:hypothetical protein
MWISLLAVALVFTDRRADRLWNSWEISATLELRKQAGRP